MKRILVTGAAGQIGSELTPALRRRCGDANVIARVAKAIGREGAIEEVLRDTSYAFAFQRHWALAKALNLNPNYCIAFIYCWYILLVYTIRGDPFQ